MANEQPWTPYSGSSASSLKGSEAGTHQALSVPPSWERYAQKKLPDVPVGAARSSSASISASTSSHPNEPSRRSVASSLGSECNKCFDTPKIGMDKQLRNLGPGWKIDEASISVVLDAQHVGMQRPAARPPKPRIDVHYNVPSIPPDEILSPQPRQSIPKILRLTGSPNTPTTSPASTLPSGHNPSQKIRQLTGMDIGPDTSYVLREVSPISPVSSSSVYSDDLVETISEPDVEGAYHGGGNRRRNSDRYQMVELGEAEQEGEDITMASRHRRSPSPVPASLKIHKRHRYSDPQVSPIQEEAWSGYGAHFAEPSAKRIYPGRHYEIDLYHATATQIAQSTHQESTVIQWQDQRHPAHRQLASTPSADSVMSNFSYPDRTGSFSQRRARFSGTRRPQLPPTRPKSGGASVDPYGSSSSLVRTPYLDAMAKSAFDHENGGDGKRLSKLSQFFTRSTSATSAAPVRPSSPAVAGGHMPTTTTVITNRDRDVSGPDTPFPLQHQQEHRATTSVGTVLQKAGGQLQRAGDQFQGLVEQARRSAGMQTRAERRREGLKRQIRVVNPVHELAGRASASGGAGGVYVSASAASGGVSASASGGTSGGLGDPQGNGQGDWI